MANNREKFPRLEKMAFDALLRHRQEYSDIEYLDQFQNNPIIKGYSQDKFLQCIQMLI